MYLDNEGSEMNGNNTEVHYMMKGGGKDSEALCWL